MLFTSHPLNLLSSPFGNAVVTFFFSVCIDKLDSGPSSLNHLPVSGVSDYLVSSSNPIIFCLDRASGCCDGKSIFTLSVTTGCCIL